MNARRIIRIILKYGIPGYFAFLVVWFLLSTDPDPDADQEFSFFGSGAWQWASPTTHRNAVGALRDLWDALGEEADYEASKASRYG